MVSDHPSLAGPIARLIEQFHRLPGIGPKMAQRLTYHLVRTPDDEAKALAEAITAMKEQVTFCSRCQNITDRDPCSICADPARDATRICVVQEPLDVLACPSRGRDGAQARATGNPPLKTMSSKPTARMTSPQTGIAGAGGGCGAKINPNCQRGRHRMRRHR